MVTSFRTLSRRCFAGPDRNNALLQATTATIPREMQLRPTALGSFESSMLLLHGGKQLTTFIEKLLSSKEAFVKLIARVGPASISAAPCFRNV